MGLFWKTKSPRQLLKLFETLLIRCLEEVYVDADEQGTTLKQKDAYFQEFYYGCIAGTILDNLDDIDKFKISHSQLSTYKKKQQYVAKMVKYQAKKLNIKDWSLVNR